MLERILKLYYMYMATGVTSPLPHLIGPAGCGKSTTVAELAEMLGVNLHIINVSRLSPLEVEGVQMPHGSGEDMILRMLPATFWTQLKEGDILLLDEFLRGFPEVYNALLDILTARRVGAYVLPKVFIIGASNTNVAYDVALEDRMLHLPVADPRKSKATKRNQAQMIVDILGLMPEMRDSMEMQTLLDVEVLPMYDILDSFKNRSSVPVMTKGHSIRNLVGQAQLREVQSAPLKELLNMNNMQAVRSNKFQFVFLADASQLAAIPTYEARARQLKGNSRLNETQALNLELNLQLIEMEQIRNEKKGTTADADEDAEFFDL